jgi:hypothetical protein
MPPVCNITDFCSSRRGRPALLVKSPPSVLPPFDEFPQGFAAKTPFTRSGTTMTGRPRPALSVCNAMEVAVLLNCVQTGSPSRVWMQLHM